MPSSAFSPRTQKYEKKCVKKKSSQKSFDFKLLFSADGGGRTHTVLLPIDFESTSSAIPTHRLIFNFKGYLCMLLQISKRTLQRYRSEGALSYKTLGKKTYYSETDVLDFLSKHVKDFRQNDIEFYKARIRNMFNK